MYSGWLQTAHRPAGVASAVWGSLVGSSLGLGCVACVMLRGWALARL